MSVGLVHLFQHHGTQRWGQRQGNEHGKQHRGDNRQGELPIDRPHRSGREGHRDEYRAQDHRNSDQRARDLSHGFAGRVDRR